MSQWLNEEQSSHMRYLASIPRERRCKCGWELKGRCLNCDAASVPSPVAPPGEEETR